MKATAQQSLSMETIREIKVVLPPLIEQNEIVRILDEYYNLFETESNSYESIDTEVISQSILSKAFKGEI